MKVSKRKLSNSITLITAPVPGVESATVQVFVRAGSRDESLRVGGLAHFLEHMVFKGTSRYPSAQAVSTAADSVGAEINASTDKERTAYHLKVTQKHIDLAFDVLSDMVFNPVLGEREIEREKGVILQEIAMYEDLPPQKVATSFEELLYGDKTPLGHDIAGKAANVKRITKNDFVEFRKKLYHPENMVISVAGKFEEEKIEELVHHWFLAGTPNFPDCPNRHGRVLSPDSPTAIPSANKHGAPSVGLPVRSYPSTPNPPYVNSSVTPAIRLVTKKTEQAHLVLGFRGNPLGHPDRYIETVLSAILGGGMSSRLFSEVREKRGLAYYVNSNIQHYTDAGYLAARAGVELRKVEEAIAVILDQFVQFDKLDLLNSELSKAKEYAKGRFLLSLEDTENVSDFFGEHYLLEGRLRTVEEVIAGIDAVTIEDVYRVAGEFFVPERLNLALVGPFKDQEKFEKLLFSS